MSNEQATQLTTAFLELIQTAVANKLEELRKENEAQELEELVPDPYVVQEARKAAVEGRVSTVDEILDKPFNIGFMPKMSVEATCSLGTVDAYGYTWHGWCNRLELILSNYGPSSETWIYTRYSREHVERADYDKVLVHFKQEIRRRNLWPENEPKPIPERGETFQEKADRLEKQNAKLQEQADTAIKERQAYASEIDRLVTRNMELHSKATAAEDKNVKFRSWVNTVISYLTQGSARHDHTLGGRFRVTVGCSQSTFYQWIIQGKALTEQ